MAAAADGVEALALVSEESAAGLGPAGHLDAQPGRLDCLERIKADHPDLPVVMMSGAGTIEIGGQGDQAGRFRLHRKAAVSYEKILVTLQQRPVLQPAESRSGTCSCASGPEPPIRT